jgi:hypothetical protein
LVCDASSNPGYVTLTAIDRWRPYSPGQAAVNHLDACSFGGCTDATLVVCIGVAASVALLRRIRQAG